MRAFFDTEFTGLHKETTLISIGIAYDNGYKFYAELTDYKKYQVDDWLKENVIDNLTLGDLRKNSSMLSEDTKTKYVKGTTEYVAEQLYYWHEAMVKDKEQIEFWSDCLAYDWVLFNHLFGHGLKLPANIYYIPFDICTLFKIKGIDPDIHRETFAEMTGVKHNALHDAEVIQACYNKLMTI